MIELVILKKYGGLWLDVIILVYNENFFKNMLWEINYYGMVCFEINFYGIEIWCVGCKKNNFFIIRWYEEYKKGLDILIKEWYK